MSVDIVFKRISKVYHEGEMVSGLIVINTKSDLRHDGIMLTMEGVSCLQLSAKTAGLIESFVNSSKITPLITSTVEIVKSGKLLSGKTEYPFEIPLQAKGNKRLHETYHGICISIHYCLRCEIKRSLLSKDILKSQEFFVELREGEGSKAVVEKTNFEIQPETLQNVRERARIPHFLVKGVLDSSEWPISEPLTGELTVLECERGISSIELQLVRVETCGSSEVNIREVSEIQNIQIAEGDVCRGLPIPIYMLFPRLFTCATVESPNFKIDYELNIVIIFDNDHLVGETFPIKLTRY